MCSVHNFQCADDPNLLVKKFNYRAIQDDNCHKQRMHIASWYFYIKKNSIVVFNFLMVAFDSKEWLWHEWT